MQCRLLKIECEKIQANEIVIGTAEVFQGQERPIIIISTVRTDEALGFVKDTRVCLSIVLGSISKLIVIFDIHLCQTYSETDAHSHFAVNDCSQLQKVFRLWLFL